MVFFFLKIKYLISPHNKVAKIDHTLENKGEISLVLKIQNDFFVKKEVYM